MALQNITQLFSPSFLNESSLTKTLGEEFVLCDNGNMVFHWADFFETCDFIKGQLESDPVLMGDFKNRENALQRLSLIPVWIKTEKQIQQTTMFDLYEKYILNQIHLVGGIDPFCPLDISFISGTGPYKSMSVAECFNKTTYRDFVIVYLIQGKLPRRDFRIRLKSKILLEYGNSFRNAELVALEQLTMNGMLFSIEADAYMKKVSSEEYVRILINSRMLSDAGGKNLEELKAHLSQYAFNLLYSSNKEDALTVALKDFSVQSSFDFSRNKRVFLFISYDKIAETHPASIKVVRDFITLTKTLVKDHYQKEAEKQKTA
ncbi:MAG: hypothetical protein ACLGHN_06860 [Bacteriovoracia bacterium]